MYKINSQYIKKKGILLKEKFNPRLDYLKIVSEIYFKGEKV